MAIIKTTNYIKKIRVALYIRVSTKEQALEGYSIGEQTERLTKFAEAHDWCIVKIYTDAGHSGADCNRPALQDMLKDIRAGKIDKVLVYKLDRLSRSQKDTLKLIEDEFLPHNTDFESMSEKLDTSTPQGRLFLGILAAFAQLEREMIKERMSMGLEARIKEGKWRGGCNPPFGYTYDAEEKKLVIHEYEAMIIKKLFQDASEGKPLHGISTEMLNAGYTLRNGKMDIRNMRYILRNKTYCGYLKLKDEWIKGLHDGIVDEETFDKVQEALDITKQKFEELGLKTGVEAQSTNLGGLLYCKRCGAKYSKSQTGTAQYGYHFNYACYSRHKKVKSMIKDPNCKNKNYRVNVLDDIVFSEIKKLKIDPDYMKQIKKDNAKTDEAQQIHAIESQIKTINGQLSRFMDLYGLGRYDLDELDAKTQPLADQKLKLQKELEKLKDDSKTMTESEVIKLVESFEEALAHGDLYDRRSIIEALIKKIVIDGDEVIIHWNFV